MVYIESDIMLSTVKSQTIWWIHNSCNIIILSSAKNTHKYHQMEFYSPDKLSVSQWIIFKMQTNCYIMTNWTVLNRESNPYYRLHSAIITSIQQYSDYLVTPQKLYTSIIKWNSTVQTSYLFHSGLS